MLRALVNQWNSRMSIEEVRQKFGVLCDANVFNNVSLPEDIQTFFEHIKQNAPEQSWKPTPEQEATSEEFYINMLERALEANILQRITDDDGETTRIAPGPVTVDGIFVPTEDTLEVYLDIINSVLSGETKPQEIVEAPPPPNFIALPLPEELRNQLPSLVSRPVAGEDVDDDADDDADAESSASPKFMSYYHHLTLMFGAGMRNNPELWKRLLDMAENKEQLKVIVKGYISNQSGIVFDCDVVFSDETPANHLVSSGVPHITGELPEGVKPVASIGLMKEAKEADTVTNLEVPVSFTASVTAFYS